LSSACRDETWVKDDNGYHRKSELCSRAKGNLKEENESGTLYSFFLSLRAPRSSFIYHFYEKGDCMCDKIKDYYEGLLYCVRNDIEKAIFYLERAASKGQQAAIETLKELKEKKIIPDELQHSC
jgi:TPR repeat protein